jgi:preprotein translocase subunit SecY
MKKKKTLLLQILKTNKKLFKQQEQLVNRYQLLSEKQEKQEKLNKITRYLALGFILVRIFVFCFNYFS